MSGQDFATVALHYSEDPTAKTNKGDLGYFTAMQMVFPFEQAAYNTKPGEVSTPIRTGFGYHIVYVTDRRPSRGEAALRLALPLHVQVYRTHGQGRAG